MVGKKGICYKKGTAPLPYDQSHVKLMGFQGIIEFKGWACCVKEVERGRAPFVIEQSFVKRAHDHADGFYTADTQHLGPSS